MINFWRSLERPLINCKVELKFRLTNHSVLFVLYFANTENDDGANVNDIIFNVKDIKLYVPLFILSAIDNRKLAKLLSKGFQRSLYWNEYKIKSENKDMTN